MAEPPVKIAFEREVRFAVVMYGGVSLAIYINGVAQELLNMVRATAPEEIDSDIPLLSETKEKTCKLKGSACVYRKLGQYLDSTDPDDDWDWIEQAENLAAPIRTRFIVDVISGTSAGGINGVFLAKALARNQTMDGLKKLWLSEGDLATLLNDRFSVEDLADAGYTVQEPQRSLLNSQRMYRKLLEALDQMDESEDPRCVYERNDQAPPPSPLVHELDLFITTTDIEGLPLPIALADRVVFERRYKNVFHFRYVRSALAPRPRDDFVARNDPFLAYAARCTSSFPFAFEPMRLRHINEVLESYPRYAAAASEDHQDRKNWGHFFSEYLRPALFDLDKEARGHPLEGKEDEAAARLRHAFQTRSFGDGGYLDNKPFSYATATLMRRYADRDIDRKLLYVEPSPEHPELLRPNPELPDFAENVRAAVLDLPRQESIREDLDRLYERNQIVERISTYGREVDADVLFLKEEKLPEDFGGVGLGEMMKVNGIGYGAYHRLKVAEITTFLAEVITRHKGHDPASDAGTAIRELVAAWRRDRYVAMLPLGQRKGGGGQQTENQFLADFDVRYRLRRIIFLVRRANELLRLDPVRPRKLDKRTARLLCVALDRIGDETGLDRAVLASIVDWFKLENDPNKPDDRFLFWRTAFVEEVRRIKRDALAPALIEARSTEEELLSPPEPMASPDEKQQLLDELLKSLDDLKIPWTNMKDILEVQGPARSSAAGEVLASRSEKFDKIAEVIQKFLVVRKLTLDEKMEPGSKPTTAPPVPFPSASEWDTAVLTLYRGQGERAARLILNYYDDNFLRYDMVTYPIEYGTGAGEANKVDVYRVSPEDAVALFDERKTGREKLAGRALMSFGAFLDKGWRKNDMLWGRLDGAERLICALLPLPEEHEDESAKIKLKRTRRNALIKQAHIAIFSEEFHASDIKTLCDLIGTALGRCEPSSAEEQKLRTAVEAAIASQDLPEVMRSALYRCLDKPERVWDYYSESFTVDRELEAETALRLISRATNITGKMLQGLAEKYGSDRGKRGALWIARLGSVFWNTIAVAVPQSLANLFFRHWLGLLYVFGATLVLAGIAFSTAGALGWKFLAATIALHLVTSLLGDFMAGTGRRLLAARIFLIVLLTLVVGCGAYFIFTRIAFLTSMNEVAVAVGAAAIVLTAITVADWRGALRRFRAAPNSAFSYSRLAWLTATTIGLGLIGLYLQRLGPPGMARFEFAYSAASLDLPKLDTVRPQLVLQLGEDYLFLISYTLMLVSYCVAGGKICWQRLANLEAGTTETNHGYISTCRNILNGLVSAGFIIAGLTCIAGAADFAENTGLLFFLRKHEHEAGLRLAYYCALLKFILVALSGLYTATAFAIGSFFRPRRWALLPLLLVGTAFFVLSWVTLWCLPLHQSANPCCNLIPQAPFVKTSP